MEQDNDATSQRIMARRKSTTPKEIQFTLRNYENRDHTPGSQNKSSLVISSSGGGGNNGSIKTPFEKKLTLRVNSVSELSVSETSSQGFAQQTLNGGTGAAADKQYTKIGKKVLPEQILRKKTILNSAERMSQKS